MVDQSYLVPLLPKPADKLTYGRANGIEKNLGFLIREWPDFEAETVSALVGSCGYLEAAERASPAQGAQVVILQRLPRLRVLLAGTGLDGLEWAGEGWEAIPAAGSLVLRHTLAQPSVEAAMAALRGLSVGCRGEADLTMSLAAERADGSLRIVREGLARMLFRTGAAWGLLEAKTNCWEDLSGAGWSDAAAMKKGAAT